MDSLRDLKILIFILGLLTACSGRQMRLPNAGYNYNRGSEPSSLNRILKAILVHESTGHGLHSGSVSNTGRSAGDNLKVTKQTRPVYSFPTHQHTKANLGPTDLTTIRVFYESNGNTGHIQPQASVAPKVQSFEPRSSTEVFRGISHSNPDHSLRYIHETALARGKNDQQYGSDSSTRRHEQSSLSSFAFSPNIGGAALSKHPGNTDHLHGTTRSASSGYSTQNPGVPNNSGYQYPGPMKVLNRSIGNDNFGTTGSGSVQTTYLKPIQALSRAPNNENPRSAINGYQYSSSNQDHNRGFVSENLRSAKNRPVQATYTNSKQTQNTAEAPVNAASNGYQYRGPTKDFESVSAPISSQVSNGGAVNQYLRPHGSGSVNTALNSYQYSIANQALSRGFDNLKISKSELVHTAHSSSIEPLNGFSNNQNLVGAASGSRDTAPNTHQYTSPIQTPNKGFENEKLRNTGSEAVQTTNPNFSTASNDYKYSAPNIAFANVKLRNTDSETPEYASPAQPPSRGPTYQSLRNSESGTVNPAPNLYQYLGSSPDQKNGFSNENVRNTESESAQTTKGSTNQNQGSAVSDGYQYGSLSQALSDGPFNQKLESAASSGYKLSSQDLNRAFGNENLKNSDSESVSNAYPSSTKILNRSSSNLNPESFVSNGYNYLGPIQGPNLGFGKKNKGSTISYSVQTTQTVTGGSNLGNTASGPLKPTSGGYQYPPSPILSPGFTTEHPSYPVKEHLQNENSGRTINESPRSKDYSYENPQNIPNGGAEQVAVSQYFVSMQPNPNHGYRYENPGLVQNTIALDGYHNVDQSSKESHINDVPRPSGYQYQGSEEIKEGAQLFEGSQTGQNQLSGPTHIDVRTHQFEQFRHADHNGLPEGLIEVNQPEQTKERSSQNDGYHYDNVVLSDSVKSVFKGQPYLPLPPLSNASDYQNESPRQPAGAKPVFRGQPYLPVPPSAVDSGYQIDDKSERPASTNSVFKGQSYLPLPTSANDSGYQNQSPGNDGYRYDKPKQSSRPDSFFKGQPYLPIPPVSGGW